MFRKREEEQRRRNAVQKILSTNTEKRKSSLVRAEIDKPFLVNIIEDLSINDSDETKKSQSETAKTKEERLKGTNRKSFLLF